MYQQLVRRLFSQVTHTCKQNLHVKSRTFHYPKRAGNLKIMKLDSSQFHGIFNPELRQLIKYFETYKYELRIAGGAVRDLLLGNHPHDIDFATTATPDEMKALFERENVRMINNKGEKHGTITARINDKENFEVTTLRIDVVTDGRHAEVEFTTDWQVDANRRDLTINAMFLGFDGTVYDYFNGMEDLEQRRVRFVGVADERMQEDYLRILRYFRFYGRIAGGPSLHEPETLDSIRQNAHGLAGISGERLWVEVKKIMTGNYAGPIVQTMIELGVGAFIGLPEKPNVQHFLEVFANTEGLSPLPMTRLSALLPGEAEMYDLHKRLKLSSEELKLGLFIIQHRDDDVGESLSKYCQDLIIDTVGREPKVKDRIIQLMLYKGEGTQADKLACWSPPKFPVTGHDLFAHNVPKGPVFAKTLNELRQIWKRSNCMMSKEELIDKIDEVVKEKS
ncbi:LOW QUALITY PROTEIN: CCA tRNA nucleotidyltransferase 1, mitochondrial-like [Haliotis rubra]|uniref:LOW QUALITY PROTEIN: CCA tRNA nucleotidyltransferase 1, mitochondrial-like n=1 Tax=Haliotis rubra TaxID=36100 RepID=UPI001EE546D4|nr:LOW QUALITY PROTEIN: CCA tRNA nucleotidyltransferase 1, mitochondrial-like [Haliotis rubra]